METGKEQHIQHQKQNKNNIAYVNNFNVYLFDIRTDMKDFQSTDMKNFQSTTVKSDHNF
jgi:hypothetical protein